MESKPSDLAIMSKPSDLAIMESKPSDLAIMESKPSDLAVALDSKMYYNSHPSTYTYI